MKITTVRLISQIFFFGLFLFLGFATQFGYLKGYPVSLFLEVDPLVAIATAITTHSLYRGLIWSLLITIPTFLLGRFFCDWVCPFGNWHHFVSWLGNKSRSAKEKLEVNSYRKQYSIKYYLLIGMLIAAIFGTLQIGLLDPIVMILRSFTISIWPSINLPTELIYVRQHLHQFGWFIGFLFLFFLSINLVIPRFFCRILCPLGALLGVLSRFSLWRIDRNLDKCVDCGLCVSICEGACDPDKNLRKSECVLCMKCLDACPHEALSFRFMPETSGEVTNPDLSRRKLIYASTVGLLFYPFSRLSGKVTKNYSPDAVRPPGSLAEPEFLQRCIKCEQCVKVCPTNVLQPAILETGLEGFWTPVMNHKFGYCELNCTLCGQVCPTGAIRKISIEEKLGIGDFSGQGPIKVGTAFYDRGRCLPWAMNIPCRVCEEVCPVSPKAIYTEEVEVKKPDGTKMTLKRPYVEPERCIGCGICEHECPVSDLKAIRVTAVGESRSTERRLLLR